MNKVFIIYKITHKENTEGDKIMAGEIMQENQENEKICEKVYDSNIGLPIYKVDIDLLREQDINARVMANDKFAQLVSNIQNEGHLESLPLCTFKVNQAGNKELLIISGHHRVRASRKAGIKVLDVLVIEREMTESEIRSKQLSHNSLNGEDDAEIRRRIFLMIDDLEQRKRAGLNEEAIKEKVQSINVDEIKMNIDFEMVNLVFLPHQKKEFEDVIKLITSDQTVMVADMENFEDFKASIRKVAKVEDIRNVSHIIVKMCEIIKDHYEAQEKLKETKKAEKKDKKETKGDEK